MTDINLSRRIAAERIVARYEIELSVDLTTWEARMTAIVADIFEPGHAEAVATEAARIADEALAAVKGRDPQAAYWLDPSPWPAWSSDIADALALLGRLDDDTRPREWFLRMGRIADDHRFDEAHR